MKTSLAHLPSLQQTEIGGQERARPAERARRGSVTAMTLAELTRENAALRRRVTELEAYRMLAYRDPLTGLWNRRYFDERITEEVDRARRRGRQVSVMIIDVNDFKRLNDTMGHAEGDRALSWVAGFLKGHLRAHDVCCRTGGDEFAVILPEVDATGCDLLTARLREKLAWDPTDGGFSVGLSIGTSTLDPTAAATEQDLIHAADRAMYVDKQRQKELARQRLAI